MSDQRGTARMTTHTTLGDALRALPLATPPADGWSTLQSTLRGTIATPMRARRPWRTLLPAALAAGLAIAILLVPRGKEPEPTVAAVTTAPAPSAKTELVRLRDQSQQWEDWLREVNRRPVPLHGSDLMAVTEIEDMIAMIDMQLAAGGDDAATTALWRQRVALLHDLGAIRTSAYSLAGSGIAANGNAAVPTSWIN
jgi:hypothetical protein